MKGGAITCSGLHLLIERCAGGSCCSSPGTQHVDDHHMAQLCTRRSKHRALGTCYTYNACTAPRCPRALPPCIQSREHCSLQLDAQTYLATIDVHWHLRTLLVGPCPAGKAHTYQICVAQHSNLPTDRISCVIRQRMLPLRQEACFYGMRHHLFCTVINPNACNSHRPSANANGDQGLQPGSPSLFKISLQDLRQNDRHSPCHQPWQQAEGQLHRPVLLHSTCRALRQRQRRYTMQLGRRKGKPSALHLQWL